MWYNRSRLILVMPPKKGSKKYYNPETEVHKFSEVPLPPPWIHGNSDESTKKLSQTRIRKGIRNTKEVQSRINESLRGHKHGWRPGTSYASAVRAGSDHVYLLKMWNGDQIWGKWGSSSEESFIYREKEFKRHGFLWEVLYFHGCDNAADLELEIGTILSEFPLDPYTRPQFFGQTETFVWNEHTEKITKDIISKLR